MASGALPGEWDGQLELDFESRAAGDAGSVSEAQQSIDYLLRQAVEYGSSADYAQLLRSVAGFHEYSPYNAMLAQLQLAGAHYVLPPQQWEARYRRGIKPGAQPIVVLRPFGPVMFVFDISQTEEREDSRPVPRGIENPFQMPDIGGANQRLNNLISTTKADCVRVEVVPRGSQAAGRIQPVSTRETQLVRRRKRPREVWESVPVRYVSIINANLSHTEQLTTLAHELGHLYCGHVGTHDERRWPSRLRLSEETVEIEAESVAYLVCLRVDSSTVMPPHLHQYVDADRPLPRIDVARVVAAAGRVLDLSSGTLPREPPTKKNA